MITAEGKLRKFWRLFARPASGKGLKNLRIWPVDMKSTGQIHDDALFS